MRDYQSNKEWRKIQQIAYGQEGLADVRQYNRDAVGTTKAIDPESVENMGGDWQDRFKALGLKIPRSVTPGTPEFRFTVWWQKRAAEKKDRALSIKTIQTEFPAMDLWVIQHCLRQLVKDGVAKVKGAGIHGATQMDEKGMKELTFQLRSDYVPTDLDKFRAISDGSDQGNTEYAKEMSRITYRDYHTFLNNAFLQAATNVLHNKFCEEGLVVSSNAGELPFRIYGDNSMLQKESSKGLVHSATTANMSRDTIYSILGSGVEPYTLNQISDRFPNQVSGYSIVDWHKPGGPLMKICHDEIFPAAHSSWIKGTLAGMKGKLTPLISKDEIPRVHSGEVF
ncbi:hypothetical protein K9N68_24725 [Kovacikia minuta CCNUW1]|uniref:hypothetical protein n=1 Tax=Kovacikia minuta TaxID=2931930 RepID=UPI001CCCE6DF|nr:hypothetical protein [Kovacikia minuta]UBF24834.1 hypothetical protein K9N68_24725 [Kovacikia minuta CCNUW1]